jgi:hypothetical protein
MTDPVANPAPSPAPVPAPTPLTLDVAPVVPATPATPEPTPSEPSGEVVYEATGDRGLDMALAFIGKQGFPGDHPAVQAAAEGDFSLLKAELAAKGVPGYAEFLELGEQAYARTQEKNKATAESARKAVHDVVGGEESWKAVQAWASANATPEEKAEINAQLSKGGLAAKAAATYLANAYSKANNVTQEPKDVTNGNGGKPPVSDGKLSAADYAKEVNALNIKLRGRLDGSPEYAALQTRRLAAIPR